MIYHTKFGEVSIPVFDGTLGVSCSGGADSTIVLLALVANGYMPQVFFIDNANSSLPALQKVIEYIDKKYNTALSIEIVQRVNSGHNLRPEIMSLGQKVDYLYTGVTSNPPMEIGGLAPNRPSKNTSTKYITPFLLLDKRASLELFSILGVNDLLPLTYTCTQNINQACNLCFACLEKNWAITECAKC